MPKVTITSIRKKLFYLFVAIGIFSYGYVAGFQGDIAEKLREPTVVVDRENPTSKNEINFSLFWRVWDILESSYFDKTKVKPANMVYGAIRGLVASVEDPYTVFLPPTENKVVQEDLTGSFSGVGIRIDFKGTQLAVVAPLPDSPAEQAGILAGDLIVGIKDDKKGVDMSTVGITLPEAVQAIRGEEGSVVTLFLLREGLEEPLIVDVVRRSIDVPSLILEFVEKDGSKIAHVQLLKFSGETTVEWENVVVDILKEQGVTGIVFDVRNNPGGYLQGAVDLASEFLESGETVVIEEESNGERLEHQVSGIGRFRKQNVVVLINKGSASSSEIFAGALRDIREVPIVGETSFGKGTIQESQQIDGGAGLHITIARWLTPSGYWVNEGGIKPDVELVDDPETEQDEQLDAAFQEILRLNE